MIEQTVSIERMEDAIDIFGSFDENIRLIEQELGVRVVSRDGQVKISGEEEPVDQAAKVIRGLLSLSARGEAIHEQNVRYLIQLVKSGNEDKIQTLAADVLSEAGGADLDPEALMGAGDGLIVTPKDIDAQMADLSKVLGYAITLALQPHLTLADAELLLS